MGVSENSDTLKSSILIVFSIINHPFWATPILGNTHIAEAAGGFGTWARSQLFVGPNESALALLILVPEARRVSVSLCYWELCDFYWVQEPRRKNSIIGNFGGRVIICISLV